MGRHAISELPLPVNRKPTKQEKSHAVPAPAELRPDEDPEAWKAEATEEEVIRRWRANGMKFCPLCHRKMIQGFNQHLPKCLPLSKSKIGSMATS